MLEKITITAEAESKDILGFAISKGYNPTQKKENKISLEEAEKKGYSIEGVSGNEYIELLENNNSISPKQFLKELYEIPMKNDLANFIRKEAKKHIEEKRKKEDEAIEKVVDEKVKNIIK